MNADLNFKDLPQKLAPALAFFQKYVKLIYFIFIMSVCIFLVFQINQYASIEPTDDAVSEKLETVQRPKVDPATVTRLEQLEDQNIEVQSLFQQARDNPFSE